MAFMAWLGVQHSATSMAAAARKAQLSRGITLSADSTTMVIMMTVEMIVFVPMLITSSPLMSP